MWLAASALVGCCCSFGQWSTSPGAVMDQPGTQPAPQSTIFQHTTPQRGSSLVSGQQCSPQTSLPQTCGAGSSAGGAEGDGTAETLVYSLQPTAQTSNATAHAADQARGFTLVWETALGLTAKVQECILALVPSSPMDIMGNPRRQTSHASLTNLQTSLMFQASKRPPRTTGAKFLGNGTSWRSSSPSEGTAPFKQLPINWRPQTPPFGNDGSHYSVPGQDPSVGAALTSLTACSPSNDEELNRGNARHAAPQGAAETAAEYQNCSGNLSARRIEQQTDHPGQRWPSITNFVSPQSIAARGRELVPFLYLGTSAALRYIFTYWGLGSGFYFYSYLHLDFCLSDPGERLAGALPDMTSTNGATQLWQSANTPSIPQPGRGEACAILLSLTLVTIWFAALKPHFMGLPVTDHTTTAGVDSGKHIGQATRHSKAEGGDACVFSCRLSHSAHRGWIWGTHYLNKHIFSSRRLESGPRQVGREMTRALLRVASVPAFIDPPTKRARRAKQACTRALEEIAAATIEGYDCLSRAIDATHDAPTSPQGRPAGLRLQRPNTTPSMLWQCATRIYYTIAWLLGSPCSTQPASSQQQTKPYRAPER